MRPFSISTSRTPAAVAALLEGMGAPVTEADVVTSAQAAARLLADKLPHKSKVLVIGGTALRLAVRERGLIPVSTAAENPQAVVQGYSAGLAYGNFADGGLALHSPIDAYGQTQRVLARRPRDPAER